MPREYTKTSEGRSCEAAGDATFSASEGAETTFTSASVVDGGARIDGQASAATDIAGAGRHLRGRECVDGVIVLVVVARDLSRQSTSTAQLTVSSSSAGTCA